MHDDSFSDHFSVVASADVQAKEREEELRKEADRERERAKEAAMERQRLMEEQERERTLKAEEEANVS